MRHTLLKRAAGLLLVLVMVIGMLPLSAFAASAVTIVTVEDILDPLDGFKPDLSGTAGHTSQYSVKKIEWTEYDDGMEWQRDLTANDTFVKGNYYFVFVTLEAKNGYAFADNLTAYVNGAKANKYAPKDNGKTVQIYYCFALCKKNIARVDLTIVNPVVGKTPTFAKVNTDEYESKNTGGISNQTNGVTWTNQSSGINLTVSNPFKENTKYTVKYYLTAKENHWFNGTKYYINGKQVSVIASNAGMTEVVIGLTNLVPGDGKKEITTLDLSVTAPKDGEKPNYTKIDGAGYYSDNGLNGTSTKIYKNGIAWYKSASSYISPGTTETFTGGTDYTVKIALTPKDGYKFSASVTAKINGKTATVETFDDGTVTVSVKLTAVKSAHTHTAEAAWQYDDATHWKNCSDKNCGNLVGEKQPHVSADGDGKCDVCGYRMPTKTTKGTTSAKATTTKPAQKPTDTTTKAAEAAVETTITNDEATKPTDTTTENKSETTKPTTVEAVGNKPTDAQNDNSAILWIVLGAVSVMTAGAVVAFVVMKKKK